MTDQVLPRADFFDLSTDFFCVLDVDGRLLDVNQTFCTVLGSSRSDLLGKRLHDFVEANSRTDIQSSLSVVGRGQGIRCDCSMTQSSGRSLLVTWSFQLDPSGVVLAVGEDRGLEEVLGRVLQDSIARSNALLEAISDGFLTINHSYVVKDVNHQGEKILRRPYAMFVGRSLLDEIPGFEYTRTFALLESSRISHEPFTLTEYISHYNAWLHVRCFPTEEGFALYLRDVTSQHEADEMLRQSEERYRGIVDSQVDLVCRYLPDTTLTFVNDAYCEFFGKTREELLGTSYLLLTNSGEFHRIHERIEELRANPKPAVSQVPTINFRGETCWIEWVDYGITNEKGEVVAIQAVGRDITLAKLAEQERLYAQSLEVELAKERELRELKEKFVSLVSHEFRTPLSVIRTSTEIVMRYIDKLSPDRIREKLTGVQEQVDRMLMLMDDVLLISKGSAKKVTFQPEMIDLRALCERLVENMSLSDQGRHHFALQMDEMPPALPLDARLLEHILINLLSNAAKYSPNAEQVDLSVTQVDHSLTFQVTDRGIGIPPEDQVHLFETFHRAGNVGDIAGTGLGLAIVKQSVEVHGGDIQFHSEVGKGTTFTVKIPLPPVA